ncbi:MAG: ATP-dependent metallopeptidase FtsH/Yme1/Tma family protein, partial [Prochlorococcus sp.]
MDKRLRNVGLYLLLVVVVVWGGTFFIGRPGTTERETLRYSEFVEAVQDNQVSRVTISTDQSTAVVVESDGRRAEVNLAPDKDLLKLLTEHNVDIAVQPTRQ